MRENVNAKHKILKATDRLKNDATEFNKDPGKAGSETVFGATYRE